MIKKILFLLLICPLAAFNSPAQTDSTRLPVDPVSGKVSYSGEISVPGYSEAEVLDKVQIWLSYFHDFRGSFGPVYLIPEQGFLHSSLQLNVTPNARTRIWWVNASLKLDAGDGFLEYVVTDFYTFTTTLVFPQIQTPYQGPLETNEHFNIDNLLGTNDNAENLDAQVNRVIGSLREFLGR